MVSEVHVQFNGLCELFKLVETLQPAFVMKFCCFLSWRNDPTKLWGGLQHWMPVINQDLEVWVKQHFFWAAWKCFKANILNWKSLALNLTVFSGSVVRELSVAMQSCLCFSVCVFILDVLPRKLLVLRIATWKTDAGKTCRRLERKIELAPVCVITNTFFVSHLGFLTRLCLPQHF